MVKIYIGLVSTPGLFASIIRRTIKQDYIHVVLGLDPELNEAYSIGRRHPFVPVISGFEKEEKGKIVRKFPDAKYQIYELECTDEQREQIENRLKTDMERRFRIHYTIIGLNLFDNKHFSLVTPKDFYEYENKKVIFEGYLRNITDREAYAFELKWFRKAYINER